MIIGVQKGGTTTLHQLLDRHTDIYFPKPPAPQEIHFFDLNKNFDRGLDWYRELFSGHSGQRVIAQTSPLYLYLPEAAERIKASLPDCKFIVTLRDPIARAHSHYWHEVRWGFETLPMIDALRAEPERITRGAHERRNFSYVDRGRYEPQLRYWEGLFSPEQLLVVHQDDLRSDPDEVARRCSDFLGVDRDGFAADSGDRSVFNPAKMPRSRRLQTLRPRLERFAPKLAGVLDRVNLVEKRYPELTEEERSFLEGAFAGDLGR